MKPTFSFYWTVLALLASTALMQAKPPTAADKLGDVQDARAADVESVQSAIETEGSASAKAAILQAFQERESVRAAQAGAASLQLELARRAAANTTGAST